MSDAQVSPATNVPENAKLLLGLDFQLRKEGVDTLPIAITSTSVRNSVGDVTRTRDATSVPVSPDLSTQPSPTMSFSEAVAAMKAGKAVRRSCGKRIYVFINVAGQRFVDALGCAVFFDPEDVFATNWEVAGEAMGRR